MRLLHLLLQNLSTLCCFDVWAVMDLTRFWTFFQVVANVYLTHSQTEGYTYNISIQTGMWKGFGTSASVGIFVNGNQGSSGEILLTDPLARRKFFSRGSVNNFTLTLPSSLGKLTDIRIWHDNSGSNPAWYLQHVVITDQQTDEM